MPSFKELRFTIEGKIDGVDFTPTTIPMSRLAEYLLDLATLLGHKESVHLIGVKDGSAQPVIFYDEAEEGRIFHRIHGAAAGTGEPDAVEAYGRIDARFKKDQGSGYIHDVLRNTNVIAFPGVKKGAPETYGPIKERATVVGRLRRVGGKGDTIPIWLERADKNMIYCETSEALSKQLSGYYLQVIRVHGIAVWYRNPDHEWEQTRFAIQSFDPDPLSEDNIGTTIDKLRAVESEWSSVKDPLEELRRMRHGEDEPTQ